MSRNRFGVEDAAPSVAAGWSARTLGAPSRLLGANGIRLGDDGRLYVAQVVGSQISALEVDSGEIEVIATVEAGIYEPDDLAFDSRGNIYATEVQEGRVSVRAPDGSVRVLADNLPAANGITVYQDRIFMDEYRMGGRLFELYTDGRAPRLLADGLRLPNALAVGPDGYIYYPAVYDGEIWRIPLEGGQPQRFVDGLASPNAVKIGRDGRLTTIHGRTGEVVAFDLQSGQRRTLGQGRPGLDNLDVSHDGRIFVSNFADGGISEIGRDGSERVIVPPGLLSPLGLCLDASGGVVAADGMGLARVDPSGRREQLAAIIVDPLYPGVIRNVAALEDGVFAVATIGGQLVRYTPFRDRQPIAEFGQIMGLIRLADGALLVADAAAGTVVKVSDGEPRVLAQFLGKPTGVAQDAAGRIFACDAANGSVLAIEDGAARTLATGLVEPHGITAACGRLYVVDRGQRSVLELDPVNGSARSVVEDLPIGPPPGMPVRIMPGQIGLNPRPQPPFTGLAAATNGRLYVAADRIGAVMVLERQGNAV